MEIVILSKEQWQELSDNAHAICFNESNFSAIERVDYALLVIKDDVPMVYATIREHDSATAYLSHGGSLPSAKGTTASFAAYMYVIKYLCGKYDVLSTRIQNTNKPMLKFAMKAGFIIDGISYHKNKVYLEHILEVKNVVGITNSNDSTRNDESESASGKSA
jgi:hypothetical protein